MKSEEPDDIISIDKLCELAGVKKSLLRRLEKTGNMPKQASGGYPLLPALAAVFRHFRGVKTRLAELKEKKLEKEAILKEIELGELRGLFLDRAKINATCRVTCRAQVRLLQRALETELPMKVAGLDQAQLEAAGKRLVDQICQYFVDETSQWRVKAKPMPCIEDLKPGDSSGE